MNRIHLLLHGVLLGGTLSLLAFSNFSCERLPEPTIAEFVDLDTAGQTTSIRVKGSPGEFYYESREGKTLFGGKTFFEAHPFEYGYAVVAQKTNGQIRYGVIDLRGRTVVPIIHYTPILGYENGLFKIGIFQVQDGQTNLQKIGYLDSAGTTVIPAEYSESHGVDGDLITLKNADGKWGILNRQGSVILPFEYREIGPCNDDRAAVAIDQNNTALWGYIDRTGKQIIPCQYQFATAFDEGIAIVQQGQYYGIIDLQGKPLTPFEYDDFQMVAEEIPHSSPHPELPNKTQLRLRNAEGKIRVQKAGKWELVGGLE